MKVLIENQGEASVRVIVEHDTVHDTVLEAGASEVFETEAEGVIELRELGDEGTGEEPAAE